MSTRFQNVKKPPKTGKTIEKSKKSEIKTEEDKILTKTKIKEIDKNLKRNLPNKLKSTSGKSPSTSSGSSRVVKSQFYPNKEVMYKNAVKENKSKITNERERNKTRTLSPSEVKVLKNNPQSSNVKRPGTATIRKVEENYESDFDSYESDFEEYLSSGSPESSISSEEEEIKVIDTKTIEEERKLDSGTYEITESSKHKQVLSNIIETIENENKSLGLKANNGNLSNLTSLSDEGFDEIKTEKIHFVNFLEAKRKNSLIKSAEIRKKRGRDLLGMIHLDNQNFTIFEMKPISYDVFMKSYGNLNYIQTSVQTGDDNVDEETSTDKINSRTVWTQFPIKLTLTNFENLNLYREDYFGVGFVQDNRENYTLKYNEINLKVFLKNTSEVISILLEEKSLQNNLTDIENDDRKLPFSDGHITFNTNLEFLKNTEINIATFSENTTKILTVHNSVENERSFLCLWKISQQNSPEKVFSVYGYVNCANLSNFTIFAGLNDGTISIWKLNYTEFTTIGDYIPPIFISDIQKGHNCQIIAIVPVENVDQTDQSGKTQVYTLDIDGSLIIWSLVELQKYNKTEINLHVNTKINFKEIYKGLDNLQCTDMCVNNLDPTQIFVSTNYGSVLNFVTTGKKSHKKYFNEINNTFSNCLTNCPFSPLYFLCGYQNGNVVLFSREIERPLMVMSNTNHDNGIVFVEWSINKPCVFYTKDTRDTIHIWDLTKSDIFPIYSLGFKERISFVKLSPSISQNNTIKRSYMVIITEKNTVSLYILNKEHGQQDKKDYEDNVRKFTNYVNRL